MIKQFAVATLAAIGLAACSENRDPTAATTALTSTQISADRVDGSPGSVRIYTLTNQPSGNAVAIFTQNADGSLAAAGAVSTGGLGSGAGLGSQGSVTLSENGRWLFAVNAGSNEISAFRVTPDGLTLTSRVASGGTKPISVTSFGDLVYVLNGGGSGNISGFTVSNTGELAVIPGSTQGLSGSAVDPGQVSFSTDGRWLVVTEKSTNNLDVYPVDNSGVAGAPSFQAPAGAGIKPFGFAFGHDNEFIVSEAATGSASSYDLGSGGTVSLITGDAATHQGAPCWVAITRNGEFAYTGNAGSGTITGFSVGHDGALTLLNPSGVSATVHAGAVDLALSRGSRMLYQLDGTSINAFRVAADGQLAPLGSIAKPAGSVGLAAF